MRWTGAAIVASLLTLGVGTGAALATLRSDDTPGTGTAQPIVATSPSSPVDPPPSLEPDVDLPSLSAGLRLERQSIGSGEFTDTVVAPRNWDRTESASTEAKWRPVGAPTYSYMLRQEQVTALRQTITAIMDDRAEDLAGATERFTLISRGSDSLHFSYVIDNRLRHGLLKWVDLDGSPIADLEIAVTGRERDLPGMRVLLERAAAGARD